MTQTLKTTERLGVVDALRGFALLAIVLLHNLEHYNLFFMPENVPAWLQTIDKYAWDTIFSCLRERLMRLSHCCSGLAFIFSFTMRRNGESISGDDLHGGCACFSCLHSCTHCSITVIFFCYMQ